MTNGKVSRIYRQLIAATETSKAAEETVAELRAKVLEADNEVWRLRDQLAEVLGRLERIEAQQAPTGYRGRSRG